MAPLVSNVPVLNGIQNQPVLKPVQAMMSKEVRKIGI
jgi:hypothetical protein